ncbi:MAG: GntR family transcriptional regulator [Deinococcales bacterium]
MLKLFSEERPKGTAEFIADSLTNAMLLGKLKSGQQLKQDELAKEFGVSKIPIREALLQLEGRGLVNIIPNRGAVVSSLSPDEVKEIYDMRIALESLALRRAIPNMTEGDFETLEMLNRRLEHETPVTNWIDLDWQFHYSLYAPSNMPRLIKLSRELQINVSRYLSLGLLKESYRQGSLKEHQTLIEACRQRDADEAIAILEHHFAKLPPAISDYLS